MEKKEPYIIDRSKISSSERAMKFKKATIEDILANLEKKKPFVVSDLVATIEGPYAHIGLMVVEFKEDGMVRIAPAPNTPTVEIHESKLFHIDDYHEAFKVALVEEQIFNPDNPQ
ncbi:MAG: hypothetical protein WC831_06335 [Parcubacteria group bacterium]|jgi:hypothetical protein